MRYVMTAVALVLSGAPAMAQDASGYGEIIVTAMRRESADYDAQMPAVGLKRTADFAVQPVTVTGDTRDADARHDEIFRLIRGAIELAGKSGVEIATGAETVEALTLDNYRSLILRSDKRPDSDKVSILIKTRLTPGVDARAALDRITAFIKKVPPVGRALLEAEDDMTLSVVRPDQYRGEIIALIAADAAASAARFGPDYAVEVRGVARPVEWARASLTEVNLYIPYDLAVVPKGK
jgi:hypothetical protein